MAKKQNRVNLKKLFFGLQSQMTAALNTVRENIPHEGSKGDAAEECWRGILRTYLPKRYRVEKAFVVDSTGGCSQQIDIVIFDQQYAPFLFCQDGAYHVPAESVYAVLEAKQDIDKGMIEYAAEKAASVRKLKRTNATIHWSQGSMQRRDIHRIPAGIVGINSKWTPPFGKAFTKTIQNLTKDTDSVIDFGCAIDSGAFDVKYEAKKQPHFDISAKNVALVSFFLRLFARLQQLGTAPAIDVLSYMKVL